LEDLRCEWRVKKTPRSRQRLVERKPLREIVARLPEDVKVGADALFVRPRRAGNGRRQEKACDC